jgi:hypothetical protein
MAAVPAAAETKSPPIRQELVHEYARKQIPVASAAHAATYACHEVTSDCDFARDLRNTERCRNAERIVKHLGVKVRKELAKIKPPVRRCSNWNSTKALMNVRRIEIAFDYVLHRCSAFGPGCSGP